MYVGIIMYIYLYTYMHIHVCAWITMKLDVSID